MVWQLAVMAVAVVVAVALCLLPGSSISELDGRGWLCGEWRRPLVCLGAVKPFVYAGGIRVSWRRLAARSLRPSPDADGVVALGGLGCALLLGYVDGYCERIVWAPRGGGE
jgi:hypothetical protein